MSFTIKFHSGETVNTSTYAEAIFAVAMRHDNVSIGHDADISQGGDRTICWPSDAPGTEDELAALATICSDSKRQN